MGIKNHNTKREKTVMRKRLRIAVFIAVSLGIVLIVFRYFGYDKNMKKYCKIHEKSLDSASFAGYNKQACKRSV